MQRRPPTPAGAPTVWKGQGLNLLGVWGRGIPALFLAKLEEWKQFFSFVLFFFTAEERKQEYSSHFY